MKCETKIIGVVDDKRLFINIGSNEIQDTNIAMKYLQQASQYFGAPLIYYLRQTTI